MSSPPQHLLLLPPPPRPATNEALQATYKQALISVLTQLAFDSRKSTTGAILDVALPLPYVYEHLYAPRAETYDATQAIVAAVYKLICVVAAKEKVNVEDAEGIDVRVILIARPRNDTSPGGAKAPSGTIGLFGPVIDLPTLATSRRPWEKVFFFDGESGESMLGQFLRHQDNRVKTQKVAGGTVAVTASDSEVTGPRTPSSHHSAIAVGGTWDHIHIGHKLLLTMFAFLLRPTVSDGEQQSLTVGITGDELLINKKFAEHLQSWDERKSSVLSFLRAIMDFRPGEAAKVDTRESKDSGPNGHSVHATLCPELVIKLVEIADPFGPTITDEGITALVLSGETRAGGRAVNEKRAEKSWPALQVLEVEVLDAEEEAEAEVKADGSYDSKLSSTLIRKSISEKAKIRAKA